MRLTIVAPLLIVLLLALQCGGSRVQAQAARKQLGVKDYSTLTEKDAVPKFQLRKLLDSYGCVEPAKYGAGIVRIYDGDLHVDGPLWMDFEKESWGGARHKGMIVTGNLSVAGNILNTNYSGGPFLVVLGDVSAQNILSGGAMFHIVGGTTVADAIIGHYNDGSLIIDGPVKARLVINDDHDIRLKNYSGAYFSKREALAGTEPKLPKLSAILAPGIKLEKEESRAGTSFETVDVGDQLIPRLAKGLAILKSTTAGKPPAGKP